MATSKDVAAAAGVSRATVSAVLNGRAEEQRIPAETAERVRAVAEQLGYRVTYAARSLRTGSARSIGFMAADPDHPRIDLLLAIQLQAAAAGWYVSLVGGAADTRLAGIDADGSDDLPAAVAALRSGQCDVIVVDCDADRPFTDALAALDPAVLAKVICIDPPEGAALGGFRCDLGRAFAAACGHLAGRGHRGIYLLDDGHLGRRLCGGAGAERLVGLARGQGLELVHLDLAGGDPATCLDHPAGHQAALLPDGPHALSLVDSLRGRGMDDCFAVCCVEEALCELADPPLDAIDPRWGQLAEQVVTACERGGERSGRVLGVFRERGSSPYREDD